MSKIHNQFWCVVALLTLLSISDSLPDLSAQSNSIDIYPEQHNQQFLGGGIGFGNYWGHLLNGQNESNQQDIYDWLFEEIDIEYIRFTMKRTLEDVNDNDDPYFLNYGNLSLDQANNLDGAAEIRDAAFLKNQNVKMMFYAQDYPDFLKTFNNNGDITGLDYSNPNLYEEIAEWVFGNMVYLYLNHGVTVEVVDLLNEPDLKPWLNQQTSADIYENVVPALREMVMTNPQLYVGPMPKIIGPSCVNLDRSADWCEIWNDNGILDNIDIISGHLYGGAWPQDDEPQNYRRLHVLKGDKQFTQNEAHPGQALNNASRLPNAALEDQHEGSLIFAAWMCLGLNNGVDVFHYFSGNNPSETNLAALVYTPWGGTPVRKRQYFSYKHFTGMVERDPYRCNFNIDAPDSYYATTLHPAGTNKVLLNIVNLAASSRNFALRIRDNAGIPLKINRVVDYRTNDVSDIELIADTSYKKPVTSTNRWFAGEAIRSLIIHYEPSVWTELDYENFETNWGIWTDGGDDARRNAADAQYSANLNYCVRLRDNTNSSTMTTSDLSVAGQGMLQINFSYLCRSMDSADEDFWLQFSNDGGNTYQTIAEWNLGDEFENDVMYNETVTIASRKNPAGYNPFVVTVPSFSNNTRLRFRCDASGNEDYVYIDSVSIRTR